MKAITKRSTDEDEGALSGVRDGVRPRDPEAGERFIKAASFLDPLDSEGLRVALRLVNPVPRSWLGAVIPLANHSELGPDVRTALRRSSAAHIGALVDALRDPGLPTATRIVIAEILGHARTRRCASELISALDTESLAIRVAIAHALVTVCESFAEPMPKERILSAIEAELQELHQLHTIVAMRDMTKKSAETTVVAQHLACCLLLLSTTTHTNAIANAIVALGEGSDQERGTGREYIDNIVSESIRRLLHPAISNRDVATVASRIYHSEEFPGAKKKLTLDELRARLKSSPA